MVAPDVERVGLMPPDEKWQGGRGSAETGYSRPVLAVRLGPRDLNGRLHPDHAGAVTGRVPNPTKGPDIRGLFMRSKPRTATTCSAAASCDRGSGRRSGSAERTSLPAANLRARTGDT